MSLEIGDPLPAFELPDTSGRRTRPAAMPRRSSSSPATTAPTRSPGTSGSRAVARDYAPRGVQTLAISSNDAERYPRDSPQAMAERVAAEPDSWPMPYLYDESQDVARAFGARTTPDVFVFDSGGRLAYRGAPDADYDDPSLDAQWLRAALDDVLAGDAVALAQTEPVGCTIKWRT